MTRSLGEDAATARGRTSAAAIAWRWQKQLRVTVVVKATFAFAQDAPMLRVDPQEILRAEVHYGNSPARSVRYTSDLAPQLLRADVLFTGHAHAPPGGPVKTSPVRLGISDGQRWLLEKSLVVQDSAGFEKMPVVYEGAFGGNGFPDNPLGVGVAPGTSTPSIIDPKRPQHPAGFAPISRLWLPRRKILTAVPRGALDGPIAEIPDAFDFGYFQAAPADQRIDFLRGDEWIVMDGLQPGPASVRMRLPSARGLARLHGLEAFGIPLAAPQALSLDTLRIDGEQQRCTAVWRGAFLVPSEEALGSARIEAGVESAGEPIAWSELTAGARGAAPPKPSEALQIEGKRDDELPTLVLAPGPDEPVVGATRPKVLEDPGTLVLRPDPQERDVTRVAAPGPPAGAAQFFHRLEAREAAEGIVTPLLELSRGVTDMIPVLTRTPFIAFTVPCQVQPPRDARTVVVKGTFDIVPDGRATLRAETDLASGDVHAGDDPKKSLLYPSDFAIFKPRADVTLRGHAYAPGGSSPAAEVRFRFGHRGKGFDRRIAVFGERRWEKTVIKLAPTEPKRFEKIPLVHEHAFGGPDFDANPVGLGGHTRLPSLEDPDHLVTSPEDTPDPAGFGAIPAQWKARWSKLGSYDGEWLKHRWPYFPDDLDWSHFQAAPVAQQLDHLDGDEPFELVGMHPRHPSIRGRLPRLRPRCFMQQTTAAGGAFREVVLRLDTAVFDVDELKINLVWRGLVEVADDDASDVAELFVMREDADAKHLAIEDVYAKYLATKIPSQPVPASPEAQGNDAGAPPDEPSPLEAMIREKLRVAGIAAAASVVVALTSPAASEPVNAPLALAAPPRHLPPEDDPIRAAVVARLASGQPLNSLDLAEANLSDLDFSGRSLVLTSLKEARLCRCRFVAADLSGAQLAGADLSDAVLDGATLAMADFTGAILEGASAAGASVTRADFSGAQGARASFLDARGAQPRFTGGSWKGARFDRAEIAGADFTRAELDDAVFDDAVAPKITLYDAKGTKVSFKRADLTAARADGACLLQSSFQGALAPSSNWEGAVLDDSTFLDAVLTGAGFARTSCARTTFSGADLAGSRLSRAKLPGASLLKANLMKASLESADLTGADLRGANLHGAETWKANLRGARLDLALLTQTKLKDRA